MRPLIILILLSASGAFANTNGFYIHDYPNTATLQSGDLFIVERPGSTNFNVSKAQMPGAIGLGTAALSDTTAFDASGVAATFGSSATNYTVSASNSIVNTVSNWNASSNTAYQAQFITQPQAQSSYASGSNNFFGNLLSATNFLISGTNDIKLSSTNPAVNIFIGRNVAPTFTNGNGEWNIFAGESTAEDFHSGSRNLALGDDAFRGYEIGSFNVAVGNSSLTTGAVGSFNTAVGFAALDNFKSGTNEFDDFEAPVYTNNIALGAHAGTTLQQGQNNIYIGSYGPPSPFIESGVIRLGNPGTHTNTIIAGVLNGDGSGLTNLLHSSTVSGVSGVSVALTQNADGSTNYGLTVTSGGSGTVTSVAATVPQGFSVSGSPITGAGTLSITRNGVDDNFLGAGATNVGNIKVTNTVTAAGGFIGLSTGLTNATGNRVAFTNELLDASTLGANAHVKTGATTNLISSENARGYTNLVAVPPAGHTNIVLELPDGTMTTNDLANYGSGGGGSATTTSLITMGMSANATISGGGGRLFFVGPWTQSGSFIDHGIPSGPNGVTLTNIFCEISVLGAGTNFGLTVYTNAFGTTAVSSSMGCSANGTTGGQAFNSGSQTLTVPANCYWYLYGSNNSSASWNADVSITVKAVNF